MIPKMPISIFRKSERARVVVIWDNTLIGSGLDIKVQSVMESRRDTSCPDVTGGQSVTLPRGGVEDLLVVGDE
jgi:hypothetical protein